MFSESSDSQETKKLKYRYNTTKTLEMARVFLVKKDDVEKEKEEVGENKVLHVALIFELVFFLGGGRGSCGLTVGRVDIIFNSVSFLNLFY